VAPPAVTACEATHSSEPILGLVGGGGLLGCSAFIRPLTAARRAVRSAEDHQADQTPTTRSRSRR